MHLVVPMMYGYSEGLLQVEIIETLQYFDQMKIVEIHCISTTMENMHEGQGIMVYKTLVVSGFEI